MIEDPGLGTGNKALDAKLAVFKALAHPTRLAIVEMLAIGGPKCVCEIVEKMPFDQSTISKHLGILRAAGIASATKHGLNVSYELRMACAYQFMRCIEQLAGAPACAKCTIL